MVRTIALVVINVSVAVLMAASVMPVAIVVAPIVRATPSAGYMVFGAAAAMFAGMNIILFRLWKRR